MTSPTSTPGLAAYLRPPFLNCAIEDNDPTPPSKATVTIDLCSLHKTNLMAATINPVVTSTRQSSPLSPDSPPNIIGATRTLATTASSFNRARRLTQPLMLSPTRARRSPSPNHRSRHRSRSPLQHRPRSPLLLPHEAQSGYAPTYPKPLLTSTEPYRSGYSTEEILYLAGKHWNWRTSLPLHGIGRSRWQSCRSSTTPDSKSFSKRMHATYSRHLAKGSVSVCFRTSARKFWSSQPLSRKDWKPCLTGRLFSLIQII